MDTTRMWIDKIRAEAAKEGARLVWEAVLKEPWCPEKIDGNSELMMVLGKDWEKYFNEKY